MQVKMFVRPIRLRLAVPLALLFATISTSTYAAEANLTRHLADYPRTAGQPNINYVAALKAQGVEFVSDPAPCCAGPASTGGIVLWFGPDGMIFETGGGVIPEEP